MLPQFHADRGRGTERAAATRTMARRGLLASGLEWERRSLNAQEYRKDLQGRITDLQAARDAFAAGIARWTLTIEAARRAMTRHIKRGGRIWIRIFPDKPVSQKPAEVRMGNGKGKPEYYVAEIQPGKVLYEMDGVDEALAREAFALASAQLPIRTPLVHRLIGA